MPVPTKKPVIERSTLREVAAGLIRSAILDGTFAPGEHLNDDELQEWLGMSRTPVREALNDLARVGLVEMVPQRFTRVALPDPAERTEVQQTIGIMLGAVYRATVPSLTRVQQIRLIAELDVLLEQLPERDESVVMPAAWAIAHQVMDLCPIRLLITATSDILDSLSFQMAATAATSEVRWDLIDEGFHRLRGAFESGDGIEAELAVEHAFRVSETG